MRGLVRDSVRTFIALAEGGTLVHAGQVVNKSPSAVSLQIAALEQALGRTLFVRSSRGMQLSDAGQVLLRHARALVAAEAAASAELRALGMTGEVRFGMPQDFAASKLARTVARFRAAHPGVRLTAVIERNSVVGGLARQGQLDLAMLLARRPSAGAVATTRRASHWYAGKAFTWDRRRPLPLAVLDSPCIYREDAIAALDRAGVRWDIAFSTGSVPAMWAAVAGGAGVTVRMDLGAPRAARVVTGDLGLPPLPATSVSLVRCGPRRGEPSDALSALAAEVVRAWGG